MITFNDWLDTNIITELSKQTLTSYKQKATNQKDIAGARSAMNKRQGKDSPELDNIAKKRAEGIKKVEDREASIKVIYKDEGQTKTKYFKDFTLARAFAKEHPGARVL